MQFKLQFDLSEIPRLSAEYGDEAEDADQLYFGKQSARRGWMIRPEFLSVAKWKSSRPQKLHLRNTDEAIVGITRRAFLEQSCTDKVLILTELHGISVRSATAILHICFPDKYALLDFRALISLGIRQDELDHWNEIDWLRSYSSYNHFCVEVAHRAGVEMRTLDRALWAYRP